MPIHRAGYYLCWGCMVWVPSMYTIHTYFLVKHPVLLSVPMTAFIVIAGITCIWINYDCDRQRQVSQHQNSLIIYKSHMYPTPNFVNFIVCVHQIYYISHFAPLMGSKRSGVNFLITSWRSIKQKKAKLNHRKPGPLCC